MVMVSGENFEMSSLQQRKLNQDKFSVHIKDRLNNHCAIIIVDGIEFEFASETDDENLPAISFRRSPGPRPSDPRTINNDGGHSS